MLNVVAFPYLLSIVFLTFPDRLSILSCVTLTDPDCRASFPVIGIDRATDRPATVRAPSPRFVHARSGGRGVAPDRTAFEPANQRRTRQTAPRRGRSRRLRWTGSDLSVWLWAAGHGYPKVREPRSLQHLAQPRTVPRAAPKAAVGYVLEQAADPREAPVRFIVAGAPDAERRAAPPSPPPRLPRSAVKSHNRSAGSAGWLLRALL